MSQDFLKGRLQIFRGANLEAGEGPTRLHWCPDHHRSKCEMDVPSDAPAASEDESKLVMCLAPWHDKEEQRAPVESFEVVCSLHVSAPVHLKKKTLMLPALPRGPKSSPSLPRPHRLLHVFSDCPSTHCCGTKPPRSKLQTCFMLHHFGASSASGCCAPASSCGPTDTWGCDVCARAKTGPSSRPLASSPTSVRESGPI